MSPVVLCSLLLALLLQFHSINGQTVSVDPNIQIVTEGETFTTCFDLTLPDVPPASDVIVDVEVAANTSDIGTANEQLIFPQGTTVLRQCINITVPTDDVFEGSETFDNVFQVTVTVDQAISIFFLGNLIVDNALVDLLIGFEQASYTFVEGTSNQVCVTVDSTISGNIFFSAIVMSLSGSASTADFVTSPLSAFDSNTMNMMECLTVTTNNDTDLEMTETFNLQLTIAPAPLSIDPSRMTATITIFDVDANCGDPPTGPGLNVVTSGPIIDSPSGTIANQGAEATYTCPDLTVTILGANVLTCMDVGGMVADWSPAVPTCQQDVVTGFEQASYTFVEGTTSNQVCVTVDGTVQGSSVFTATLESTLDTASADDFMASSSTVAFDANTMNMVECITVTINNDTNFESAENFTFQLTMTDNNLLMIDPSHITATITILDVDADCGDPPTGPGLNVVTSGPIIDFPSGTTANMGAVATYTCDQGFVLMGSIDELMCVDVGNMTADWSPAVPTCITAPTTTATPTPVTTDDDDDSNTGRNVGIGVGVGVGGALLILLIVLLIVFLCIRYRRGKRHSKYVLNYNTVYGTDQRPAKREERQANTSETAELGEPADDPNVGQDVADDEGEEVAAV